MKKYSGGATIYLDFFDAEGETPEDAVLSAFEDGRCVILDTFVNVTKEEEDEPDD